MQFLHKLPIPKSQIFLLTCRPYSVCPQGTVVTSLWLGTAKLPWEWSGTQRGGVLKAETLGTGWGGEHPPLCCSVSGTVSSTILTPPFLGAILSSAFLRPGFLCAPVTLPPAAHFQSISNSEACPSSHFFQTYHMAHQLSLNACIEISHWILLIGTTNIWSSKN